MTFSVDASRYLPRDGFAGTLIGRAWVPATKAGDVAGPSPVLIAASGVYDLSPLAPTCAELLEGGFSASDTDTAALPRLGSFEELLLSSLSRPRSDGSPRFLSPVDLQAIKACGVTFVCSLLERVIEEHSGGDAGRARAARTEIRERLGSDLCGVRPGSPEAEELKRILVPAGLWSPYLEVGLGPDVEIFTKSQPLSSVGLGEEIGIHACSSWSNPEPEVVLLVDCRRQVLGATLGNDVNLRDVEGRSALLLGRAKDNNASCAIGPFIRLFDETFDLDDVRRAEVSLTIEGEDGFVLRDTSEMSRISRDVLDLVAQTMNESHHYPDGMVLFTGTLFVPTHDRFGDGKGFTHRLGDVVTIGSEKLGLLQNSVTYSHRAAPWELGISALMRNLSQRDLL